MQRKQLILILGSLAILIVAIAFVFFNRIDKTDTAGVSSCLVFEEKNCSTGTITETQLIALGFGLSPGDSIYAPFDGTFVFREKYYLKPEDETYNLIRVEHGLSSQTNSEIMEFTATGYFVPSVGNLTEVSRGDVIASVADKEINILGKYSTVITFDRFDQSVSYFVPNKELLQEFFSYVR